MKKVVVLLAVFVAAVLGLTACGSSGSAGPPAASTTPATSQPQASTASPSPSWSMPSWTSAPPAATSTTVQHINYMSKNEKLYLSIARKALHGQGTRAGVIAVGKKMCQVVSLRGRMTDALYSASKLPGDKKAHELLIGAAIVAFCPREKGAFRRYLANSQTITLKVYGAYSASDITYSVGDDIEQKTNVTLPWSKKIKVGKFSGSVGLSQLSAQNNGGGKITCEIDTSDGKVADKKSGTGDYAIADCSTTSVH